MKTKLIIPATLAVSICLTINACIPGSTKQDNKTTIADTIQEQAAPPPENEKPVKEITGKVKEILSGKDGYTAKVATDEGTVYAVTVSRANLKDPSQYKSFKTGDKITVKGDSWKMGEEEQITVRELK